MSKLVLSDAKPTGYNNPLTEDEVETIVSLKRDEGLPVDEIAERVGRSRATILRYLSRNGISFRTPRIKTPPFAQIQYEQVKIIKESGKTSAEVSAVTGFSLAEVNRAYGAPAYDYYINHR
jgi:DNA invertase Pin-like site-specific DNA recombinase